MSRFHISTDEWDSRVRESLSLYFGFPSLRDYQKQALLSYYQGRDVMLVVATGYGKSLCYQLPALCLKKTVIVISPLIALMEDQVAFLRSKGISSLHLGAVSNTPEEIERAKCGEISLLYMTPEKALLWLDHLSSLAARNAVCLLAIDEAHCASEWGHDFRPDYAQLGQVRAALSNVQVMALTATATTRVAREVCATLQCPNMKLLRSTVDRANLRFFVHEKQRGIAADLEAIIAPNADVLQRARALGDAKRRERDMEMEKVFGGVSVVYCLTR